MKLKTAIAATTIAIAGLAVPGAAMAAPAQATHAHASVVVSRHACTRTSSGSCIRGGEFCPRASYGQSGWDAVGRRYVCKGSHTRPHWMLP